jgi:hypothetical protein
LGRAGLKEGAVVAVREKPPKREREKRKFALALKEQSPERKER